MKIELSKLRKDLEKTKNQKRQTEAVMSKMNEELKQKNETIKKNATYINKLENQLLKGNFSSEFLETNRKLEDKVAILERENKEYEALNNALKTKILAYEDQNTILNSCLVKNIIIFKSNLNSKSI